MGRATKDTLECLLLLLDTGDLRYSRVQVRMPHLAGINNREPGLLLKRLGPAVPELCLVIQGVQNRRRVALANPTFYADRGGFSVGEGEVWIMAGAARNSAVGRQTAFEKKFLTERNFFRTLRIVRGNCISTQLHCHANLLKRLWLR